MSGEQELLARYLLSRLLDTRQPQTAARRQDRCNTTLHHSLFTLHWSVQGGPGPLPQHRLPPGLTPGQEAPCVLRLPQSHYKSIGVKYFEEIITKLLQSITQPLRRLLQKAKENIEVIDFRKPPLKVGVRRTRHCTLTLC